eukprot:TRINITY_DN369_c0_g1_i2.p1 TRINITY_DN369_c0_g1~~TRINITY_DN369_c0_g1_i2.p1  ORF type:complete len:245 (+),score=72.69 TRINITY_DN369_c0_g1_i2:72-806(+)
MLARSISKYQRTLRVSSIKPFHVARVRNFSLLPTRWAEEWVTRLLEKEPVIQLPATGKEALEATHPWEDEYLDGPFGTFEKPVVVTSVNSSRIVGCAGGPGYEEEHEITWHVLHQGRPLVCLDCGQVFKLQRVGSHPEVAEGAEKDKKVVEELASSAAFKEDIHFDELDNVVEKALRKTDSVEPKPAVGVELLSTPSPLALEKLKPLALESVLEKLKKEGVVLVEEEENSSYNLTKTLENRFGQ